jgi:sporulation protein YlmC with PRC-barrel domain
MSDSRRTHPNPLRIDFNLLDRQIVDCDGALVGNVDDVELEQTEPGAPRVTALLVGQVALGERIGGRLGRWLAASARRLSIDPGDPPIRIPYHLVASVGSEIVLRVKREIVPEPPLETWFREHLISRIPGADNEGK